jgi:hypothetical protein
MSGHHQEVIQNGGTYIERRRPMRRSDFLPVAVAAVAGVVIGTSLPYGIAQETAAPQATVAPAQTVRARMPFLSVENEPPPRLIVDDPLPEGLNRGIVWIQ